MPVALCSHNTVHTPPPGPDDAPHDQEADQGDEDEDDVEEEDSADVIVGEDGAVVAPSLALLTDR